MRENTMKASLNKIEIYNTYPLKVMFPSTEIPPSAKRAQKNTFVDNQRLLAARYLCFERLLTATYIWLLD